MNSGATRTALVTGEMMDCMAPARRARAGARAAGARRSRPRARPEPGPAPHPQCSVPGLRARGGGRRAARQGPRHARRLLSRGGCAPRRPPPHSAHQATGPAARAAPGGRGAGQRRAGGRRPWAGADGREEAARPGQGPAKLGCGGSGGGGASYRWMEAPAPRGAQRGGRAGAGARAREGLRSGGGWSRGAVAGGDACRVRAHALALRQCARSPRARGTLSLGDLRCWPPRGEGELVGAPLWAGWGRIPGLAHPARASAPAVALSSRAVSALACPAASPVASPAPVFLAVFPSPHVCVTPPS